MKTSLFDYPLPDRLIAQKPADRRDDSRLLVVHRREHRIEHRRFRDLPEYLHAGDTLFRNNAAVIPARLHAVRPTGGQVECLLLRPTAEAGRPAAGSLPPPPSGPTPVPPRAGTLTHEEWWCLLRPGRKLPVGAAFGRPGVFTATVREKAEDGTARVAFACVEAGILAVANRLGEMPLPPYIKRHQEESERLFDRERYQTVYADRSRQVAAAAPTAGLHFTAGLLATLAAQGVRTADLTLHVGLGTFRPIATEEIEDHPIHRETYEIPPASQAALLAPAGRRCAVGTTSVRTIEDFLEKRSSRPESTAAAEPGRDEAALFIHPPRCFRGVDALLTNFHQPRSTLLCLVAAFLAPGSTDGIEWLREIYHEAVAREYRFFSFGDAMLIL